MKSFIYKVIACHCLGIGAAISLAAEVSFNRDIRPIMSDTCFLCHGRDAGNREADLRLDRPEDAYADRDGAPAIVPGDPANSLLIWMINAEDEEERMPPQKHARQLTGTEKNLFYQWIEEGAPYDQHWSFKPLPQQITVPANSGNWAKNEIDHFIAVGIAGKNLKPAPESSREKWLRRVTFDLTGLPPTLDEIDHFLADESDGAFENVVDRLLSSPAYAERMTGEWIDVARYSDSYGYQRDHDRSVWPWRDWVIDAFKANMPYEEFIKLQLAGDLLPDPAQHEIIPTAFNRLHAHKMEGGIVLEEYRVEYVADRTQTFSTAFLGLTMECARCHDHKYDPFSTEDYYSLSSFFANIDEAGLISYFTEAVPTPAMPISNPGADEALAATQKEVTRLKGKLERVKKRAAQSREFKSWMTQRPQLGWPGLVADISFDERDGETLVNSVVPDHAPTSSELNLLVPGIANKAIQFTGDDAVEVPEVGHFNRENPFSAALWIRPKQISARENIFSRGGGADDAASLGYEFLLLDGKPTASIIHYWPGNGIRVQAKEPIKAGQWHHVAVTYDGSSHADGIRLYVNGQSVDVTIIRDHLTRQITEWTGDRPNLVIGQRYRDRGFVGGQVDEFRMFDRELVSAEVRELYDGSHLQKLLRKHVDLLEEHERTQLLEYFMATSYEPVGKIGRKLQAARAKWNRQMDELPALSIMRELPEPRPAYVLERGQYNARGEEVVAETPQILPPFPQDQPRNRLGLANWLTSADHPLAARVAVNRYWQVIFGQGLVRTPEDFGTRGAPPTHPELLDWLARDFVDHGWNLHRLLKQMVCSATYRQTTQVDEITRLKDPNNETFCRSNPDRLSGEMIRDNALAVSGLLAKKIGGPPVKPYELAVSFKPVDPDQGDGLYRRSLYTLWKRNSPAPTMVTFDAPKRDVCTVKREATASPLQPLIILNGPQFVEASRVLAERLITEYPADGDAQIEKAFLLLTSRYPENNEFALLRDFLDHQVNEFRSDPEGAKRFLEVGQAPIPLEIDAIELAAKTVVINTLMNFNESIFQR